jgi:hypothetical protein
MRGKRDARARVRGSGMARLTGAGLAISLAGAGVAAYLIVGRSHASRDASELPTKVLSTQAVGLINPGPQGSGSEPQTLLATRGSLTFTGAGQVGANWTADQMSGGTYIFIYLPNGLCLGSGRGATAALQRCSLQAGQRWVPERQVTGPGGVDYSQLRNLSDRRCLTAVAAAGTTGPAPTTARLERCQTSPDWHQLIAFITAS